MYKTGIALISEVEGEKPRSRRDDSKIIAGLFEMS